jgi:transposase
MDKDMVTMSAKELKRLHIIKKADEKLITQKDAATMLTISERQFRRVLVEFRKDGARGLIHKNRGKQSPNRITQEKTNTIVNLYQSEFLGYKPTFFTERLGAEYGINISKESVRKILINYGLWTPKKKKNKHRTKRERKRYVGELIQVDGSVHQWFLGDEGYCVLMLYIDDATSRVFARFYTYEGTIPAMDSFRRYISKYGIPLALYADRHSTYKNNNKTLSIEEQLQGALADTQFSRALRELSVSIIPAYSPQAKGRVERSFNTFQDRLGKELHRHKIITIKDANTFLEKYLKDHNNRFSVTPAESTDLHRPAPPVHTLKKSLCIKTQRSIANDYTIRHNLKIYQLKKMVLTKKATVEDHTHGSVVIRVKNESIPFVDVTHKFIKHKTTKTIPVIRIDPVSLKEITG